MINSTLKIKKKIGKNNKKDGFTLIEMIAVIAIIGILSTVLIPKVSGYINEAKKMKVISECRKVVIAVESYNLRYETPLLETVNVSTAIGNAVVSKYLDGDQLKNIDGDSTTLKDCYDILNGAEFTLGKDTEILDPGSVEFINSSIVPTQGRK